MKMITTLACLALAATACSTSTGDTTGASSSDQILTLAAAGQGPAKAAVEAFEKANPGVTVKTTFTEDDASYQQQLRTQLASGTAPDVFRMWPGGGNTMAVRDLGEDGMLMDLSGESWAGGLSSDLKSVTSDPSGKVVAVPVTIGAIGAVWNDQAMQKSGLSKPTTWPEVLRFCKDAKAKGVVPFALGLKSAWVTQLVPYALTASLVYGPNAGFTQQQKDGKTTFSASQWKQALEKYLQMREEGCFNDSPQRRRLRRADADVRPGQGAGRGARAVGGAVGGRVRPAGHHLLDDPVPRDRQRRRHLRAGVGGHRLRRQRQGQERGPGQEVHALPRLPRGSGAVRHGPRAAARR
ncbi:hypothetical protein GCM10020219_080100 [Nonomuraea dietziae]